MYFRKKLVSKKSGTVGQFKIGINKLKNQSRGGGNAVGETSSCVGGLLVSGRILRLNPLFGFIDEYLTFYEIHLNTAF
jgi:hypothetical protein